MAVLCQSPHVTVRLVQSDFPPAARSFIDLVHGVPQVLGCLKSYDGRYAWSNAGFANRLGLAPEEVVGRSVDELFPPDFASSYTSQDAAVLATGRPLQRQLELIVHADGGIGWYVTSKSCVVASDGSRWGVAVLSFDLHAQLQSAHSGLARVIDHIRGDVGHAWRVSELAELAGLTPKQLERLARRTLGLSPQRLVQRLRIEHAVQLITTTRTSIGEIAATCGFYDQSSFTRQFRAVLGVTPGAYRRRP